MLPHFLIFIIATLSTNSSWAVVDDAAHFVQHGQPQVIIEGVRDILAQVTLN